MDIFRKAEPSLIHECPYNDIVVENKPFRIDSLPSVFTGGDYKLTFELMTMNDQRIIFVEVFATWFSSEKKAKG